jgi:guanyl-specific ribonuclease Sa
VPRDIPDANGNLVPNPDFVSLMQLGSSLAGAAAGALAGGNVQSAALGQNVALTATQNNYLKHKELTERANSDAACKNGDKTACQRVKDLDALSATRDEATHNLIEADSTTVEQNKQIQLDLITTVMDLRGLRTQLIEQLNSSTTDPALSADLHEQLNKVNSSISQVGILMQDNLFVLADKTGDQSYIDAAKQLVPVFRGGDIQNVALMLGPLFKTGGATAVDGAKEVLNFGKGPSNYGETTYNVNGNVIETGKTVPSTSNPVSSGAQGGTATINSTSGKTTMINGVTVVDQRTGTIYQGTVDLQPTLDRIANGGAPLSRNDGTVFQNRPVNGVQLLPAQSVGYYTEYVVPTPGINGPGPQRIITGQGGEIYYTPDHYQSFIPVKK